MKNICARLPIASALLSFLLLLTACGESGPLAPKVPLPVWQPSTEWIIGNLLGGNAEPRLRRGLATNGFYGPYLDADWTPSAEQRASLISQSRFIYLMAVAYEVSGDERYRSALRSAADFLLRAFPVPDQAGRWRKAVDAREEPVNGRFHAYGHAHVMFATAHAFHVTGDVRYRDAAYATWLFLNIPAAVVGEGEQLVLNGLNVAMHTFEGLLVLYKATGAEMVRRDLVLLAEYIAEHFYSAEAGVFAEWLHADGRPKLGDEIRLGHNIEMAFLFSRAVDAGLTPALLEPAFAVVDFVARRVGERKAGLIVHTVSSSGDTIDAEHPWWGQAELLRGLAHFVVERERGDLVPVYEQALRETLENYVGVDGSWSSAPSAPTKPRGEEWKVGYHVSMMLTELLRLRGFAFSSGPEILL